MAFVGILSECKSFENIREYFKIKKRIKPQFNSYK